ncbi:rtr1 rpap2 family [Cystoisospora suis]|uniref:Rtr1 rpap2 family n=1 Tax=Cystoisospora suis TaxID=483139 RepID=A0A2C6KIF4_9APIC|nr:rtr1 rpap2 family [Cystoisospora suis]
MNVASFSAAEKTASHAVPNCETTSHERAGSSTRMKKNEQGSRSRVIPVKLEEEATTSDDGERYQETIEDKQEVPCGGKNFKEENSVSQQQRQGLGKTYKSHLAKSSSSSRRPVSGVHERGVASTQKPSRFHLPHLPAAVDQVLLLDYSQGETEPPTESRNASQERQTEDAGQNTDGKESALVATGGSRAGKTDQDVHKENAAICEDRNDLCRTVCLHNQVDTRSRGAILSQCGGGSLGNFEGAAELQGGRPRSTEGHGSVAETGFRQSVPDAPGNGKNCRLLEADAGVKSDSEEQAACEPPARPIAIVDLEKKSEEGLAKDISEFLDFSDDEPTDFPDTHLQNKDLGNGNQKGRARHLIPGPPTTTDASQNARYSLGVPGAAPSSVGLEVQRAYMRLSDLAIVWDLLGSWSRAETRDVLLWIRSGRVKRRTDNTEESVSAAFPGQAQCLDGKLADNRSAEAAAAGAVELQQQRSEQLAQALLRALPSSLLEHCGRDVADVCRTFRIKRALPPLPPSLCRTFLAVVFLALHGLRRSSTSSASSTRVSCGGATMAMSEDPGCVDTVGVRDWVNRADKDDGDIECGVRLFIRGAISDAASRCSRVQRGDTRGDASSHRCTVGPRPTLGSAQEDKTAEVSLLHPPGAMPAPEQRMATGVGPAIGFSVVSAVRECDIQAEQEGRLGTRGSRFDTNSSVATDGDGETVAWWWAGKCLAILFGPLVDA